MIEDPRLQLLLNIILGYVDATGDVLGDWWKVHGAGWLVTVLLGLFRTPDGVIVNSSGSWLWEILACLPAQVHTGDVLAHVTELLGCVHVPVANIAG